MPDQTTIFARQSGRCPDWAWYQLNEQSAQKNYNEQKATLYNTDDNEACTVIIESKVETP